MAAYLVVGLEVESVVVGLVERASVVVGLVERAFVEEEELKGKKKHLILIFKILFYF